MNLTDIRIIKSTDIIAIFAVIVGLIPAYSPARAEMVQGAVVTRTEGETKILIKKIAQEPAPTGTTTIKFENETYFIRPTKNGDRPANGDVITTGKDGKVRLIFRNGDQVTVTPGTAFKFSWDAKSDKSALAEIIYGDIRAVIQPDGPRSGMKVQTKTAVLGVRGTDFYVSAWSKDSGSKVAVMRGKVALAQKLDLPQPPPTDQARGKQNARSPIAPKPAVQSREVEVSAGTTGFIKASTTAPGTTQSPKESGLTASTIEVASTTKQELIVIQTDSKVTKPKIGAAAQKSDPLTAEIAKLEAKSVETTLQDVKRYDPELYAKLQEEAKKGKITDADVVQAATVKKIFETAPSEKKEIHKPTLDDLDTGGDVYDKYKWERN